MQHCRAKFVCSHVVPAVQGYPTRAYLYPVLDDGCEENKTFNTATPSGHLEIDISEDAPAHKYFIPQREYYVDFTRIPLEQEESKSN